MITHIEEEFYKIVQPIIQQSDTNNASNDFTINLDLILSRDKINLIGNIKTFIKSNLSNPNLSTVFSKHLSIIFSQILFKSLDDQDQNVRIAADEGINQVIRLTYNLFSPYIIYNLFVELKNNTSPRSINGALHKFAAMCHLIKHSKRLSYVNNVLPVLQVLLSRQEESVLCSLVECLPRIAETLFPYASDSDLESIIIIPLLVALRSTEVVCHQRNLSQLVAITCCYIIDRRGYLQRVLQYCVSIDFNDDNNSRVALFLIKSLLTTIRDVIDVDELVLVVLKLFQVIESDISTAANKNLALDCLWHVLQLRHCVKLADFLSNVCVISDRYMSRLQSIDHSTVFLVDNVNPVTCADDLRELTEIAAVEEEDERCVYESQYTVENVESEVGTDSEADKSFIINEEYNTATEVIEPTEPDEPLNNMYTTSHLGTYLDWYSTTLRYIIKLMITHFLPDIIDEQSPLAYLKNIRIRVNSRVLAINCLAQVAIIDYNALIENIAILDDTCELPAAIDCVLAFYNDEDSQLCGSAVLFMGQMISSLISSSYLDSPTTSGKYDYVQLIDKVQWLLDNTISGQHMKFVLSALKLFLRQLSSTTNHSLVFRLLDSVLRFTDHNYKLVRREVVAVFCCVDFRSVAYLEQRSTTTNLLKQMTVSEKCISAMMLLLFDVEQDVREDACSSLKDLFDHGAFDDSNDTADHSMLFENEESKTKSSSLDRRKLIPFLCSDINVSLNDVRKYLQYKSSTGCPVNYGAVHRCMHIVIEQLLATSVPSGKEMKTSLNRINGCLSVLIMLLDKYPIITHPRLWAVNCHTKDKPSTLSITRNLLSYCISLLNNPFVMMNMSIHTDILHLVSRLILHGGIEHLLRNDLLIEKTNANSGIVLHLNTDLSLSASLKLFMVHLCRMLNIFWHIFQFITPVLPLHKTVLPNLTSQTTGNAPKKKAEPTVSSKSSTSSESQSSTDSRPPRSRSSLGFFVNEPHYMSMHKTLVVAYNSFLISTDSANYSDRLLTLLAKILESLSIIMEVISFNEVSPFVEEFLSYCSVFYGILPTETVEFIIKLLGSLFGTNITAQWDPFLSQVFSLIVTSQERVGPVIDISEFQINEWRKLSIDIGASLQTKLRNASISTHGNDLLDLTKWQEGLFDTFSWIKASGKRREPGILRHMVSSNSSTRPNLGHYIGLFEKHVFQCMRQYISSPPELQTTIIQLLCQLIYLRVNYCQLDSEQKFLNIILNQLENFTSGLIDIDSKSLLIIEITEFLILITYEKAGPSKRDQPILNLTQVIHSVESLLLNGINIRSVIIPCLWKIVCDLFVHRSVWLHNPGNFNLIPNANTSKEIDVQREAVLDLLLRKLLKCPETLDILSLIIEHSAREHELKWEKLSDQVWAKVSSMLMEDQIEFSEPSHIDCLLRLVRVIAVKSFLRPPNNVTIVDLVLKYQDLSIKDEDLRGGVLINKSHCHIIQSVRSVVSLQCIIVHNIEYWKLYKPLFVDFDDDRSLQKEFVARVLDLLKSLVSSHTSTIGDKCSSAMVNDAVLVMGYRLIRMLLLVLIDIKRSDCSIEDGDDKYSGLVEINQLCDMDHLFGKLKERELNVLLLWDELKCMCGVWQCSCISTRSPSIRHMLSYHTLAKRCRNVIRMDECLRLNYVQDIISDHYVTMIELSTQTITQRLFDVINIEEKLSTHLLDTFSKHSSQISNRTSMMIKWLRVIEQLHLRSSGGIITLLRDYVMTRRGYIPAIIVTKIDMVICSRFGMLASPENEASSNVMTILTNLEDMIAVKTLSFPKLSATLCDFKQHSIKPNPVEPHITDPLANTEDDNMWDEKKFWKLCVEKSLSNHDQDVRLCPRLLQGGTQTDLEQMFAIKITETLSEDLLTQPKRHESSKLSTLPPRFIQQCLRLGFLRSGGGGLVQDGNRVDVIFQLGEKLMFQELTNIVDVIKSSLRKEDYAIVDSSGLIGILAALNNYLNLICQLSVPMPLSSANGNRIVHLIEDVCSLILRSERLCSRILIEEILSLITVYFCPFTLLTDDGIKDLGKDLAWSYISVVVDFLHHVIGQFDLPHYPTTTMQRHHSLATDSAHSPNLVTVIKMNDVLNRCLRWSVDCHASRLHQKLKLAIITIVRLPCLVRFCRNPNNVQSFDIEHAKEIITNPGHRDVLELDCLSKMNRDDLAAAQSIFARLGWTSRFMFEETWLIYLDLLHDKGPSSTITGDDAADEPLSPEEVVEQGHCDSLGLLGLANMLLKTTARPSPGNPVMAQLEHRPRDKTPNLLHTKIGRKLSTIHGHLDDEIFSSHRGFKMMFAGWSISSWNIEREDSILQYRHDQINVNVLAKRISIGSRSPQISGSDNNNLDVLSCLQSLPIIYEQWLQLQMLSDKKKSAALWPRACALQSSVILMDLFSSREQVQWLFDCLLELTKSINIEDDWITMSWLCIGLSKCVAVLETSSNTTMPVIVGKSQNLIPSNSIYGLLTTVKLVDTCLNSDLTILQQSALHSAMFLLQMTVYGKATWDLPTGSLVELKNLHEMVINYLEGQLLWIEPSFLQIAKISLVDVTNNVNPMINSSSISHAMSTGAANFASTVSGLTSINNMNSQLGIATSGSSGYSSQSSMPRLVKPKQAIFIRSERHNHLIMATACFYCETYPDALPDSEILNNFVTLAKNIMQPDRMNYSSATSLLILCRCLERCILTQRIASIVIEQVIRICSNYLKTSRSTINSLPVLRLFLTSCFLSLANSMQANPMTGIIESVFSNGPSNGENQLIMLERVNVFWKRLTDPEIMDVVESRILSRLISSIMTEFMSNEEVLNKTVHQLLRSWPKAQYVAKTLFDIITRCLNQPDGEKLIRKWTLMVLPSLTSCRPVNLSVWVTTIVLVASGSNSRASLRAIFSQCLDWLTQVESGSVYTSDMETCLFIASFAFIKDMSRDPNTESENKAAFFKALHPNLNIPSFHKLYTSCLQKKLV